MGYAAALAWVLFLIIMAMTAIQFLLARSWVYYEGSERT
jgi:multiple sugar transport system permease protein